MSEGSIEIKSAGLGGFILLMVFIDLLLLGIYLVKLIVWG